MNKALRGDRHPSRSPQAAPPGSPDPAPPKRRAQSLVEFAMILPLLFVLTVGIMEFGWLFRNYMTVHYTTREAARVGAVAGDLGGADYDILQAISTSMETMSYDDLLSVKIYKQDPNCASPCLENIYTRGHEDYPFSWHLDGTSNWPSGNRKTAEPTDAIGVEMEYRHHFLVNLIPGAIGTMVIDDHSVVQIEPAFFGTPTPTPLAGP
jgi:hypothetical protein